MNENVLAIVAGYESITLRRAEPFYCLELSKLFLLSLIAVLADGARQRIHHNKK